MVAKPSKLCEPHKLWDCKGEFPFWLPTTTVKNLGSVQLPQTIWLQGRTQNFPDIWTERNKNRNYHYDIKSAVWSHFECCSSDAPTSKRIYRIRKGTKIKGNKNDQGHDKNMGNEERLNRLRLFSLERWLGANRMEVYSIRIYYLLSLSILELGDIIMKSAGSRFNKQGRPFS